MAYYKCGSVYTTQNSNVVVDTASGAVANFQTPLAMPLLKTRFDFKATQEAGTPTPQSPKVISGVSAVNVIHCHKNLLNLNEVELLSNNRYGITITKTGVYRISGSYNGEAFIYARPILLDGTLGDNIYLQIGAQDTATPQTVTINSGETLLVYNASANQTVEITKTKLANFQIEVGTAQSEHEAYNGSTTLINLGGTYYGGYVSQDKAGHRQFEVTHSIIILSADNMNIIGRVNANKYRVFNSDCGAKIIGSDYADILCDILKSQTGTTNDGRCYINASGDIRMNFAKEYNSVADMIADVESITLVYPLAEPIEIPLSAISQFATLVGTNNIFADTGDTSIQFRKIG